MASSTDENFIIEPPDAEKPYPEKPKDKNLEVEELKACRACFNFIQTDSYLVLNSPDTPIYVGNIINLCLPKVDLSLIKDPLICQKCFEHLENFYNLVTFCMKTEKELLDYCSAVAVSLPININDFVTFALKSNTSLVAVKQEDHQENSNAQINLHESGVQVKSEDCDFNDNIERKTRFKRRLGFRGRTRAKIAPAKLQSNSTDLIKAEVKCETCGQKFNSRWALDRHIHTHRDENSNYSCAACHTKFKYKHSYDKHVSSHFSGMLLLKPFSCECGKSFNRKAKLKKHQEIHIKKERPFGCKNCGKRFIDQKLLDGHVERVHVNEKAFGCDICGNKYTNKAGLDVHMKSHIPSDKPRPEPDLMCDICGKLFYRKYSLEKHHMSHTGDKPHECEQCGTKFKERYQLTIHMRRHTGEKPFGCEVCGFKFSCKNRLSVHMRKHTGVRPFPCHLCDMAFTRNDHLIKHIRAIHTGERPFECDICSKSFYRKDYLLKHKHNVHVSKSTEKVENDHIWS